MGHSLLGLSPCLRLPSSLNVSLSLLLLLPPCWWWRNGIINDCRCNVEILVNLRWYWLDFRSQLLLNAVEVEPVLIGNQINRQAQVSEPPRTSDTMQVCLTIFWKVKVDYNVNGLYINAASE